MDLKYLALINEKYNYLPNSLSYPDYKHFC